MEPQNKRAAIKELIGEKEVAQKVYDLAKRIEADYSGIDFTVLCVMNGSFIFTADLVRNIRGSFDLDFIEVSSYGVSQESSGQCKMVRDLNAPVKGKHILITEDIIDSGQTLEFLLETLEKRGAASVEVASLLVKKRNLGVLKRVRYSGFSIGNEFVVGYGMDYAYQYRHLPFIGTIDKNYIAKS